MDGESEQTSLKGMFQGMIPTAAELLQGTVTSTSPLKIQIANDSKLTIGESITVVPRHLTNYSTSADITWGEKTSLSSDTKTASGDRLQKFTIYGAGLTVHNALQVGETVHVLSLQNGKKYYVLDRV
jgi:hypothetical protein